MNDGRKSARRTVVHGAWIFAGADAPSIPCVLQDVSETGARIKLDPAVKIPTDFILVLSRDKRLNRRCRMIWRDKGTLGVRFVTNQSVAGKHEPASASARTPESQS